MWFLSLESSGKDLQKREEGKNYGTQWKMIDENIEACRIYILRKDFQGGICHGRAVKCTLHHRSSGL